MRFLADAGISPSTVAALQDQGHDAVHVRVLGRQRATDREILDLARDEERVVLTFDLDFSDLLALGMKTKPSTVIFRLSNETAVSVNVRLLRVISEQESELARGVLIMVEDTRYRVRRLPVLEGR